jgi:hypothetical protein
MVSITGLPFERNTMTAVEVDELDTLRKFWRENHDGNGKSKVTQEVLNKEEALYTVELLISLSHKNAVLNVSNKCKDYADAAASVAQAVLTMEKV